MDSQWGNCFFCLNTLNSCNTDSKLDNNNQVRDELPILMKYLVDTEVEANELVLHDIYKLLISEEKSESSLTPTHIQFCNQCESVIRRVSKLHLELEVIQMKLVNCLKTARETILTNSKIYGHNEATKLHFQALEDCLSTQDDVNSDGRKVLDLLYAFQSAVFERGKDNNIHVPHILLTPVRVSPRNSIRKSHVKRSHPPVISDVVEIIKIEPDAEPLELPNDFVPSMDFMDSFTEDYFDPEDLKSFDEINVHPLQASTQRVSRTPTKYREQESVAVTSRKPKKRKSDFGILEQRKATKRKRDNKAKRMKYPKPLSRHCPQIKQEVTEVIQNSLNDSQQRSPEEERSSIKDETELELASGGGSHRSAASAATKRISKITRKVEVTEIPGKERDRKPKNARKPRGKYRVNNLGTMITIKGRTTYSCETCSYFCRRFYRMEAHLRGHETPDKIYKCTHCDARFSGKQLYELHLSTHSWRHKIKCDVCNKGVIAADIMQHLRNHNVDKLFFCQCCSFCCGSRTQYIDHIEVHTTDNLICDICSERFKSRPKFFKHMFEQHNAIEELQCDIGTCRQTFLDPFRLAIHKRQHPRRETFKCEPCGLSFPHKTGLEKHLELFCKKDTNCFLCHHCSQTFGNIMALERHKIEQHGAPNFVCPYCNLDMNDYREVNKHILKVHPGEKLPCRDCDMSFGSIKNWQRHTRIHRENDYVCEECGKTFKSKSHLVRHTKTHDGVEKKFKCPYCPKAWAIKQYLNEHVRIHTGERPYVCHICGKAFTQSTSLNVHKKSQHKEECNNASTTISAVKSETS